MASDEHFHLAGFHRERQAAFRPDFQAERDGLFDVFQCRGAGLALADAAGNGRTFHHPHAVFIAVNGYGEFHASYVTGIQDRCKSGNGWLSPKLRRVKRKRTESRADPFSKGRKTPEHAEVAEQLEVSNQKLTLPIQGYTHSYAIIDCEEQQSPSQYLLLLLRSYTGVSRMRVRLHHPKSHSYSSRLCTRSAS